MSSLTKKRKHKRLRPKVVSVVQNDENETEAIVDKAVKVADMSESSDRGSECQGSNDPLLDSSREDLHLKLSEDEDEFLLLDEEEEHSSSQQKAGRLLESILKEYDIHRVPRKEKLKPPLNQKPKSIDAQVIEVYAKVDREDKTKPRFKYLKETSEEKT